MSSTDDRLQPTIEQRARRRVALKTGFYTHALVFVLVNAGLFVMSAFNGWGQRFGHGSFFPLWGWGLGLSIHGIVVFLKLQGEGVRQRMLEQEIKTLQQRDSQNDRRG